MVYTGRFKEFKALAFRNWFIKEENIQKLKDTLPEGVRYLNAYYVILGPAEHQYEVWYELDNWAALDTWHAHKKWDEFWENEIGVFDKGEPKIKFLRGMQDVIILEPKSSED
ncbi:MAG: hypothetical protein ACFFEO_04030 [Candidatus Thorarchaeota archaeon]